jgi:ParB family protein of integrating conjugative element (PFGI_1 class)
MNQPAGLPPTAEDDDVDHVGRRSVTSDRPPESRSVEGQILNMPPSILSGSGRGEVAHGPDAPLFSETLREVRVVDIDPYDRNPRKAAHERYHELKQAIFAQNLLEIPALTRRPGSERWMLASGGNTRIRIVRELWEETGDTRFEKYVFPIKPWRGDTNALLTHLSENESRAELCFWDRAFAFADLQQQIAREKGVPALSLREFEAVLASMGLRIGKTMLSNYRFLIQRLGPLENCAARLSGNAVQSLLQPQLNKLSRLLAKWDGLEPDAAYAQVLWPAMRSFGDSLADPGAFDASNLCEYLLGETAAFLERTPSQVERMLALLDSAPELDRAQLEDTITRGRGRISEPIRDAKADEPRMPADRSQTGPAAGGETQGRDEPVAGKFICATPTSAVPLPSAAQFGSSLPTPRPEADSEAPQVGNDEGARLDDAKRHLAAQALKFASAFGLDALCRPEATLPSGFSMAVPGVNPPLADYDKAMAFWWLVHFSRQLDDAGWGAISASRGGSRTIEPGQPDSEPSTWAALARQHLGFVPERDALIGWMCSPANPLDLFQSLLQAAHARYSLDPK